MSPFIFLYNEAVTVIRVKVLNIYLTPAGSTYHNYVRNVIGATMKGVDWQSASIHFSVNKE